MTRLYYGYITALTRPFKGTGHYCFKFCLTQGRNGPGQAMIYFAGKSSVMAKALPGVNFIGTINGLTSYRRKDSDDIIVRRKGGPTEKQVRNQQEFQRTRENNSEFAARVTAGKMIKDILIAHRPVINYNIISGMSGPLSKIQQLDEVNERGKRNIYISRHRWLLEGIELNQRSNFASFLPAPLELYLSGPERSGRIVFPALINGINLKLPASFPFFRFTISLGKLPDVVYNGIKYLPGIGYEEMETAVWNSAWMTGPPGTEELVDLKLNQASAGVFSLLLAISISFGVPDQLGNIKPVRYMGAGKLLKLG